MNGHIYSPAELRWLKRMRPRAPMSVLGPRFRARFGADVKDHALAQTCTRRGFRAGTDGRFVRDRREGREPPRLGVRHPSHLDRPSRSDTERARRRSSWMNDAPPARMRRLRSRGREGFSPSVRPVHHSSEARLFCRSARSLASIFSHVPSDFFPSANAARSKIARSSDKIIIFNYLSHFCAAAHSLSVLLLCVQKGVKLSIHQWWRRAIGGILPMLGLLMISTADADIVGARLDPTRAEVVQSAMIDQLGATGSAALEDTRHQALIDRAWSQGAIPVIVLTDKTEARDGSPAPRLLGMLGLGTGRDRAGAPVKVFSQLDGFAMRADALDLLDLLDDPSVVGVVEDVAYSPDVLESVPLLGASFSNFGGFNGSGQTVAILDTGFDRAHPMLSGKIVAEGCYSTHVPSNGVYSLCPGEVGESVATGSSAACSEADWGVNCGHGTHVAGIAVGNSSYYKGVASGASLIAIQVFSGFTSSACGGSPCVMAYLSDIIKGLERVEALRQQYAIASVNLSLGGGTFSDHCDDYPAKPVIDRLRTAGIASVMSAGNSGHLNAVGAPACVSSAISVGASCDYQAGALCTEVDAVASYSNRAAILSLLAPGSAITSALPGGRYEAWHGTSMAAPHVAGAWAVLKQAKPTVSVEEALAALKMSGRLVQDGASGLTLARIRPAAAIEILGQGQIDPPENESGLPPAVPTDLGSMNVTRNGFTLKWNSVPGASGYQIDISRYWNFSWMLDGYRNLDVGAATQWNVSGLQAGITYFVRVRAYNDYGTSVDSAVLMIRTPRF